MKTALLCLAATFLCHSSMAADRDQGAKKNAGPKPLGIADLVPTMDKKEVTVRCTVEDLHGIAGAYKPGHAPWFGFSTKLEHDNKNLGVWIEDELADVLDRLQMSVYQSNQLKKGTIIVATGVIRLHQDRSSGETYTLHVNQWRKFRIVPPAKSK